jgi:hypothetical protein
MAGYDDGVFKARYCIIAWGYLSFFQFIGD